MIRSALALSICLASFSAAALAQQPGPRAAPETPEVENHLSLGELTPTPEMWFYQQEMRRYEDPKWAVRRNAEFRAAQRHARLASLKWFGYSNSRPMASPDPMYGSQSPHWGSNSSDPWEWRGSGPATIIWESPAPRGYYR